MSVEFESLNKCQCECHYNPDVLHCFPCCERTYEQYETEEIDIVDYTTLFPDEGQEDEQC